MFKAFFKLRMRDRVILVLAVIIGVIVLVRLVSMVGVGRFSFGNVDFPDSGLAQIGDLQDYKQYEYDNLSVGLGFPGTYYGVSVGGSPIASNDKGVGYKYSDNTILVVSIQSNQMKADDVIEKEYPAYAGIGTARSYSPQSSPVRGYINGMVFDYFTGVITTENNENYFVLTYTFETAEGQTLYMSSLTSNPKVLRTDRDLLLKVIRTLGSFEQK